MVVLRFSFGSGIVGLPPSFGGGAFFHPLLGGVAFSFSLVGGPAFTSSSFSVVVPSSASLRWCCHPLFFHLLV